MSVLSYLKLSFTEQSDMQKAEADINAMFELAKQQKGFEWAEILKLPDQPRVYVVLSQWATLDDLRAWEHHPDHEAVMGAHDYQLERKRYSPL